LAGICVQSAIELGLFIVELETSKTNGNLPEIWERVIIIITSSTTIVAISLTIVAAPAR
jgi:hypothetical protein